MKQDKSDKETTEKDSYEKETSEKGKCSTGNI